MSNPRLRLSAWAATTALGLFGLAGCAGGSDDIVGNWTADDQSGTKVITDDGRCSGMYYNHGEPLDIGGGMSCSFSDKTDEQGRHSLVVSQPPNEETLQVEFTDADTVEVYQGGDLIFTMTRE